ncbi:hypothetical protein D9M68_837590 [compost metagenome]
MDFAAPISAIPLRMASSEAAGIKFRKVSTPRIKSRLSYSFWLVSFEGNPSEKLKVPRRVCTLSGVMISGGILLL